MPHVLSRCPRIPGRNCVIQRPRHPYQFSITYCVYCISSRRACYDIQFTDRISLAILREDRQPSVVLVLNSPQTTVDDDVEAVTDVLGAPQDLAGIDLHPIQ